MTDDELLEGFEKARLPRFTHADHLRVALIYLARFGRDEALRRLSDGLRLFAASKGHPEKFHVTMTRAWLDLLDTARGASPGRSPAEVLEAYPGLLDPQALARFYSAAHLESPAARSGWLEPDLAPLDVTPLTPSPSLPLTHYPLPLP